jgi:hypothetical protein
MKKFTRVANKPTLSELLLAELAVATSDEDFEDATFILKRALQPYGTRLTQVPDAFTADDKKLLHTFWCMVLETKSIQLDDVVLSAMPLFETICTAAHDRTIMAQQHRAKARCKEICSVCEALLAEADRQSDAKVLRLPPPVREIHLPATNRPRIMPGQLTLVHSQPLTPK